MAEPLPMELPLLMLLWLAVEPLPMELPLLMEFEPMAEPLLMEFELMDEPLPMLPALMLLVVCAKAALALARERTQAVMVRIRDM